MNGSRLDAWTRRRFGIATRGVLAAALSLAAIENGAAKKNKNTCRKLGKTCKKGGNNKKKCCGSLTCDAISFEPSTQTHCCRQFGRACSDNADCCAFLCCATEGTCTDFCAQ
jgi:hypothetical protein